MLDRLVRLALLIVRLVRPDRHDASGRDDLRRLQATIAVWEAGNAIGTVPRLFDEGCLRLRVQSGGPIEHLLPRRPVIDDNLATAEAWAHLTVVSCDGRLRHVPQLHSILHRRDIALQLTNLRLEQLLLVFVHIRVVFHLVTVQ